MRSHSAGGRNGSDLEQRIADPDPTDRHQLAADEGHGIASGRDTIACERDLAASERDQLAEARDREAEKRDAEIARLTAALGHDHGTTSLYIILRAAGDRAAAQRAQAARDRERAARDRELAAKDRADAAAELEATSVDALTGASAPGDSPSEVIYRADADLLATRDRRRSLTIANPAPNEGRLRVTRRPR